MAVVEVACPGCKTVLRAPDNMAGKKARCKKCNTPFRIPGPAAGDSVGESQMLSAVDTPAVPPPTADPFDFLTAAATEAAPPKDKSTPKAKALLPEPKPAAKRAEPKTPGSRATGSPKAESGFDFGGMLDEAASEKPPPRSATGQKPAQPLELDDEVPEAAAANDEPAAASDDPFGFPAGGTPTEKPSHAPARGKPTGKAGKDASDAKHAAPHHGYHRPVGTGGRTKLILAVVGVLVLGAGIAGAVVYVNKLKDDQARAAENKDKEKDKKAETPTPELVKNDPGKTEPKDTKNPPDKGGKKRDQSAKSSNGPTGGKDEVLVIDAKTRTFDLLPPAAKAGTVDGPEGTPLTLDVEFDKVRRFFPPAEDGIDVGVLWEREKGLANTPGNKLVLDVCNQFGTRRHQIDFTGDGRPVPVADFSQDGLWFAHADGGRVSVWKVGRKDPVVSGWDAYATLPEPHKKAGLAAVYFPPLPKEKGDAEKEDDLPARLVTVSTAGAVHLWDLKSKGMPLGEYVPPKGKPGRVVDGRGVVLRPDRKSLLVAVGGAVYQVMIHPDVSGGVLADLDGDVPVSLALACSEGGPPVVYAFETEKKEKVVALLGSDTRLLWRWPDSLGVPVGAARVSGESAAVTTSRGMIVWFEVRKNDNGKFAFSPRGAAVSPNDRALYAADDTYHWYLIPDPAQGSKCKLLHLGAPGLGRSLVDNDEGVGKGGKIPTWRIDVKGLTR
jgi:hypothetical protein